MARTRTRAAHAALLLVAALALLVPVTGAGVLAPFELDAADLARRIAAAYLGAGDLAVAVDPAPPTLGDLGMGEAPFVATALAFRLLGLDAAVGRLPAALFAVTGVVAVWALCVRVASGRVAAFAVVILASCPLFAVNARTMLGDGVTLAAFALAWAGLAGVLLDGGDRRRVAWMVVAAVGLAVGYLARGALLGVAGPLLAVGLGGVSARPLLPATEQVAPRLASRLPTAFTVLGLAAAGVFLWRAQPVAAARGDEVLRVVGMSLDAAAPGDGTFDRVVRQVGHAAFPWSALAPFALGRLLVPGPLVDAGPGAGGGAPRDALRIHVLAAVLVSLCLTAAVAPWAGDIPWSGVGVLAVALALALDDVAERELGGVVACLVVVGAGAVLALDLAREPARALAPLSVDVAFPAGVEARAGTWFAAIAVGVLGPIGVALATGGPGPLPRPTALARSAMRSWRAVLATWGGWLAFGLVVIEAALAGLAAMVLVGRWLAWDTVLRLSRPVARVFLHAFWAAPLVLVSVPLAVVLAALLLDGAARALAARRVSIAVALAGITALAYSTVFHGEVAARLSPGDALEVYASRRRPEEPLGLVALGAKLARFHGATDVSTFDTPDEALPWLAAGSGAASPRRWLLVPAGDLGALNALHRARLGHNVPVADASGEALLVVSDLGGAPDQSPLSRVVLDAAPQPARPVAADLDGVVALLGWEVRDADGVVVSTVSAGTRYQVLLYVRSLAPLDASYRPFLHVDRGTLRWNGDESFVDDGYPSPLWQRDDVVVLRSDLELDANFGPGAYDVWFGFFAGGARLPVVEGPARGDRVHLGALHVR